MDDTQTARASQIRERLDAIEAGEAVELIREADERERPHKTWAVGCRWEAYEREDLLEIAEVSLLNYCFAVFSLSLSLCLSIAFSDGVAILTVLARQCMGGKALAVICQMFCEEWDNCTGGMPDLW